jgi:hypothetical protein
MDDDLDLICRQTDYSREEARAKLEELGDPIQVIRGYMPAAPKKAVSRNPQQTLYDELNKFVEDTAKQPIKRN